MGLNERRKIKELEETVFPARTREIEEICGKPISYEVDWKSLEDDAKALNFVDHLSCHPIHMALRVICADALGKEAVQKGLKQIQIKNVKTKEEKFLDFKEGILEIHGAYALQSDGVFSDSEIRKLLEDKL